MRTISILVTGFILLFSQVITADTMSCDKKVYKTFLLVEKSAHRVTKRKPDIKLQQRMESFEINCPYQVEADLNGDKRNDWVGIVSEKGKYSLIAYISGAMKYQMIKLIDYEFFPEATHLEVIATQELSLISQRPLLKKIRNALVINTIGKLSHAYTWNGKTIEHYYAFESQYYGVDSDEKQNFR